MIYCLDRVLDSPLLASIRDHLHIAHFTDGGESAGWNAKREKRNGQCTDEELGGRIRTGLLKHPALQKAALPKQLGTPLFSQRTAFIPDV